MDIYCVNRLFMFGTFLFLFRYLYIYFVINLFIHLLFCFDIYIYIYIFFFTFVFIELYRYSFSSGHQRIKPIFKGQLDYLILMSTDVAYEFFNIFFNE